MNEAQGIHFGTLSLSGSLLTTWLVMLLLLSFSAFIRHKLQQEDNLWRR